MRGGAKGFALDPKKVTLRIFPNDTGAPTYDAEGGVASVARSAAGKFLVTLNDGYYKVIGARLAMQSAADNLDMYAQLGEFNNVYHNGAQRGTAGSATTFVVKLKTGATNTDVAAAAQTCIFVEVEFEDLPPTLED